MERNKRNFTPQITLFDVVSPRQGKDTWMREWVTERSQGWREWATERSQGWREWVIERSQGWREWVSWRSKVILKFLIHGSTDWQILLGTLRCQFITLIVQVLRATYNIYTQHYIAVQ